MSGLPIINLADLPLPNVLGDLDYDRELKGVIADFVARWKLFVEKYPDLHLPQYDVETLETDPAILQLENGAFVAMLVLARINDAARGLMLASAEGTDLEHFAADFNVKRMTIRPAAGDVPAIMESNQDLRTRRNLAPDGYAAAGPEDAYRFFALSADPSIKEAEAIKGQDNRVDVVLLSRDGTGAVPGSIVTKVHEALSPKKTRPLTDNLHVRSASIVEQKISVRLTIPFGPDRSAVVQKAKASITAYAAARKSLGKKLYRDGISAAARNGNAVETVEVVEPSSDIDPGKFGAVHVTDIIVESGE